MPTQIPFDWREDESTVIFVLSATGVKAKNLSVAICDVYVKVNLPPSLFEVDLLHEIDPEHPKTRCRVSPNKVTVTLQKRVPQIWGEFRATGAKADLRARRQAALDALEQREAERQQKRKDFKEEMLKQGEHAQWRLDSQNRETIEKWEQEEKAKWEEEVFGSFDADTGDLLTESRLATDATDATDALDVTEVQEAPKEVEVRLLKEAPIESEVKVEEPIWSPEELDDTEEYVPEVRASPGKIGLRFTERPRPGVPVRDRGRKAPPFPKDAPKTDLPPMMAGDDREEDENDPVWLKDKGDQLMVRGDYSGAYNAYTEALKLASNARCFANRAVASLYLGNFEQCLEDCTRSIQILDFRNKPRNGELHHSPDPEDEKVRARVEIRMGVAFLWLGAFKKAEAHFEKALSTEGLDPEEIKQVKQDLERVQSAYAALKVKEQADQSLRLGDSPEAVDKALALYGQADDQTKQDFRTASGQLNVTSAMKHFGVEARERRFNHRSRYGGHQGHSLVMGMPTDRVLGSRTVACSYNRPQLGGGVGVSQLEIDNPSLLDTQQTSDARGHMEVRDHSQLFHLAQFLERTVEPKRWTKIRECPGVVETKYVLPAVGLLSNKTIVDIDTSEEVEIFITEAEGDKKNFRRVPVNCSWCRRGCKRCSKNRGYLPGICKKWEKDARIVNKHHEATKELPEALEVLEVCEGSMSCTEQYDEDVYPFENEAWSPNSRSQPFGEAEVDLASEGSFLFVEDDQVSCDSWAFV
eukprot:symbB.v1.2.007824.t2/scaffold463.1/size291460/5